MGTKVYRLRLVFTSDVVEVASGVISSMELEPDESECFHFFRFRLRLRRTMTAITTWKNRVILLSLLATPTMQFSLDRKRRSHKRNRCSASDFVGFIFNRSLRSTLLVDYGSDYDYVASFDNYEIK